MCLDLFWRGRAGPEALFRGRPRTGSERACITSCTFGSACPSWIRAWDHVHVMSLNVSPARQNKDTGRPMPRIYDAAMALLTTPTLTSAPVAVEPAGSNVQSWMPILIQIQIPPLETCEQYSHCIFFHQQIIAFFCDAIFFSIPSFDFHCVFCHMFTRPRQIPLSDNYRKVFSRVQIDFWHLQGEVNKLNTIQVALQLDLNATEILSRYVARTHKAKTRKEKKRK